MKRILSMLVAACMLLAFIPIVSADYGSVEVSTFEELQTQLRTYGDAKIIVKTDIEVTGSMVVDGGHKILVPDGERTITRSGGTMIFDMFYSIVDFQIGEEGDDVNLFIFDGENISGATPVNLASGKLVIKNAVFKNFTGASEGGAINVGDGAKLTVDNGTFENCLANNAGGAISTRRGSITINNGTFKNCTADDPAIVGWGGCWAAVHAIEDATLTINGGSFTDCKRDALSVETRSVLNLNGGYFNNCRYFLNSGGPAGETGKLNVAQSVYDQMNSAVFTNGYEAIRVDTGGGWVLNLISGETPDPVITLDLNVTTAAIDANYDFGSATLIFASYSSDEKSRLLDVYAIDVSYSDTSVSIPSSYDFQVESGGKVKAMLWNNIGEMTPLAEASVKPVE